MPDEPTPTKSGEEKPPAADREATAEKEVDEEWKRRAQEEKAKDAAKARAGAATRPALPPVDFTNFVASLGLQAMIGLGEMENPVTKKKEVDLDQAQYTIDMLELLREKTKGNLTPEEEGTLGRLLFQLKMAFVQVAK
ncbi:MAG: DUF1844 domain-containing protein [Planctomycetes bacterium]|nr:DUF1844 domain-containing protein [Planctomycetota bacterium]